MSQALYTDDETGSEIRDAEGGYLVVNGEGEEIALVEQDQADTIASIMHDLLDDDTEVQGVPGPEGDGWTMGQMRHSLFGFPTGFGFQRTSDGELAAFRGELDLAEDFAEVFGSQ